MNSMIIKIKKVPQSGLGHHELLALQLQLLIAGEDEDRLEGARDEEHPHRQLPDEHVVREVGDVLEDNHTMSYIGTDAIFVWQLPWWGRKVVQARRDRGR